MVRESRRVRRRACQSSISSYHRGSLGGVVLCVISQSERIEGEQEHGRIREVEEMGIVLIELELEDG